MTAANLDHANLNAAVFGGVVREDVMDKIWQIDNWSLPLTEMCSKGTHGNQRVEFTIDTFAASVDDNAVVDGADIDQDDSKVGTRVGNFTQTSVKEVQVSTRANASNSIGRQGSLSYQIAKRQIELRRDVETQMLSNIPSLAGDALTVPGNSAGLNAWLSTTTLHGVGGSAGGFNTSTGIIDAATLGTARAISETMIKDIMQGVYEAGGEATTLMATPTVIRLISEFFFGSTAKAATMTNDNMTGTSKATAYTSTNIIVTDFGTLTLVPNRQQLPTATDTSTVFILDPKHLKQSFMTGYRVEPLAKTGLSEKRLMCVDYSLLVLNEAACGMICDVDETAAMVA